MKSIMKTKFSSGRRSLSGACKMLVACAAVALACATDAATKKIGDYTWTYQTVKGGVAIGDGTGPAVSPTPTGSLSIPAKIGNYAVKSIATRAFDKCGEVKIITIPKGVTSIGAYAFNECTNLLTVTLPSTLKSIGMSAFYKCGALESIKMPSGVTDIAAYTFYECTSLRNVVLPSTMKIIGNYAFYGCRGLVSLSLASVDTIGPYAFANSALISFGTPARLIGEHAFEGCELLRSAVFLPGASVIGECAFKDCNLEYIVLPHSTSTIWTGAFNDAFNQSGEKIVYYEYDGAEGIPSDKDRFTDLLTGSGFPDVETLKFILRCKLTVKSNNTKYGTAVIIDDDESVTSSKFNAGDSAHLVAKPKKGYVFAGWFTDKACTKALNPAGYDNRKSTIDVIMPRKNSTYYAKFITKAAAKKSLKFTSATKKLAKTATVGSPEKNISIKVAASSATLTKLSAKGLPSGMSFDAATGMITGMPTKPGSHSITITAKDAAGNTISQKVKITAEVMSWSRGTYYGRAMVDSDNVPEIAQITVDKTGKVSGKINYKGKDYSFTSKCTSSTTEETKFPVKVKISSKKTFSAGTVSTFKAGNEFKVVCAESANKVSIIVQKRPGLLTTGGALEKYIGKTFVMNGSDEGSSLWGLKKSSDKLTFTILKNDTIQFTGKVNGEKVSAVAALRLIYNTMERESDRGVIKEVDEGETYTTYSLYADLVALKGKYFRYLLLDVMVDSAGSIQAESWNVGN